MTKVLLWGFISSPHGIYHFDTLCFWVSPGNRDQRHLWATASGRNGIGSASRTEPSARLVLGPIFAFTLTVRKNQDLIQIKRHLDHGRQRRHMTVFFGDFVFVHSRSLIRVGKITKLLGRCRKERLSEFPLQFSGDFTIGNKGGACLSQLLIAVLQLVFKPRN